MGYAGGVRHLLPSPVSLLVPLFSLGCLVYGPNHGPGGGGGGGDADAPEGAFSGECHNGEDDDRDGLVDCRDDDCADATNCQDHVLPDTGGDDPPDSGAVDEEEGVGARLGPDPIEDYAVPATTGAALLLLGAGSLRRRR